MESVKRYKAMVNLPDGVLVADVYLSEDFDRIKAEREALQVRVNGLLEDFQELSEQSERRSRLASGFEDRMGCLQVENGKLRDRISLLDDSGEHVESHLERQADILRIERDALQQRLTVQDQREDDLKELLSIARQYIRDLASSLENACEFFEGNEEDDPQATEECEEARRFTMRIEAALNPTAEAVSHE